MHEIAQNIYNIKEKIYQAKQQSEKEKIQNALKEYHNAVFITEIINAMIEIELYERKRTLNTTHKQRLEDYIASLDNPKKWKCWFTPTYGYDDPFILFSKKLLDPNKEFLKKCYQKKTVLQLLIKLEDYEKNGDIMDEWDFMFTQKALLANIQNLYPLKIRSLGKQVQLIKLLLNDPTRPIYTGVQSYGETTSVSTSSEIPKKKAKLRISEVKMHTLENIIVLLTKKQLEHQKKIEGQLAIINPTLINSKIKQIEILNNQLSRLSNQLIILSA